MPRVGLTFKLDEHTVLRGGYGMFYGFLGQRRGDVFQSGFSQNTNMIPSLDNGLTFIEHAHEPVPERHPGAGRQPRSASQTFLGPERHVLRSEPEIAAHAALAGRASSASSPAGGWPRPATSATTARSCRRRATSTRRRNQYLSTSPMRDQATHQLPRRQRPESVLRTDADSRRRGASAARTSRASGCCGRIRSSTPSTRRPTRAGPGITRCRSTLQRRFAAGYTISGATTPTRSSPRPPSS